MTTTALDAAPVTSKLGERSELRDLAPWLYLWLPVALFLVVYAAAFGLGEVTYRSFFVGEASLVEIPTVVALVVATVMGVRAARDARALGMRLLPIWLVLGALGCFYFAGEEVSWGQWILHWQTPDAWAAMNDQQETNLHNLEGIGFLFDQLPRTLLTLGAVVGGILMPLVRVWRRKPLTDPERFTFWILPTLVALPTAALATIFARADRTIGELLGRDWPRYDMRTGEVKELMLGFFLMVYLTSIAVRLRQVRTATRDAGS